MNKSDKLSPHFSLGEMTKTSHRYIDNAPSYEEIARLAADMGCTSGCTGDINGDGHTDLLDAELLFGAWLCGVI